MSATSTKTDAIGTKKPYKTVMSAQANQATPMCSQYEWGMILVWQYGSLFSRNMIGKIVPMLSPQIARVTFPIAIGIKMAVYLKGVQMAT